MTRDLLKSEDWSAHWWGSSSYERIKINEFEIVDAYLSTPPKRILDIGCGLAFESEMFQKKYDSDLYLLDGDAQANQPHQTRRHKYNDAKSMKFYTQAKRLRRSFDQRGMRYHFIDAAAPSIPNGVIFDLIYSIMSCGFHYPLSTYVDLIKKHTDKNSRLIFDIRQVKKQRNVQRSFDVIAVLMTNSKCRKCEIKFQ